MMPFLEMEVQMGCSRYIKMALAHGFLGAACSSGMGSVGSLFLSETLGRAGYSTAHAAAAGALGGSLLGGVWGFFSSWQQIEIGKKVTSCKGSISLVGIEFSLWAASGALGGVLLNTLVDIPLLEVTTAVATGVGLGAAAVVVLGGCCLIAFCNKQDVENIEGTLNYVSLKGQP